MADLLAASIQVSGLSEEELEARLGWDAGSVRRLLEGEKEPDPEQVLRILGELGETAGSPEWANPVEDYEQDDERTQVVTDLVERFRRLGYESRELTLPAGGQVDVAELEHRVSSVLRDTFGDATKELDED
jgi:transcriptional regulator with XRE-family HTH domain